MRRLTLLLAVALALGGVLIFADDADAGRRCGGRGLFRGREGRARVIHRERHVFRAQGGGCSGGQCR